MKRLLGIVLMFILGGCAHMQPNYTMTMEGAAGRVAAGINDELRRTYAGIPILVTAPVDAVSFEAGDFGLAMQELLMGALTESGANVVDVELRQVPYINCEDGLNALSRDARKLQQQYRAGVIVVSTYIVRERDLLLSVRAVDYTNSDVIASASTTMRKSESVEAMLKMRGSSRLYER